MVFNFYRFSAQNVVGPADATTYGDCDHVWTQNIRSLGEEYLHVRFIKKKHTIVKAGPMRFKQLTKRMKIIQLSRTSILCLVLHTSVILNVSLCTYANFN